MNESWSQKSLLLMEPLALRWNHKRGIWCKPCKHTTETSEWRGGNHVGTRLYQLLPAEESPCVCDAKAVRPLGGQDFERAHLASTYVAKNVYKSLLRKCCTETCWMKKVNYKCLELSCRVLLWWRILCTNFPSSDKLVMDALEGTLWAGKGVPNSGQGKPVRFMWQRCWFSSEIFAKRCGDIWFSANNPDLAMTGGDKRKESSYPYLAVEKSERLRESLDIWLYHLVYFLCRYISSMWFQNFAVCLWTISCLSLQDNYCILPRRICEKGVWRLHIKTWFLPSNVVR